MGKNKTEIFESMPVRSAVRVMIIPAVISQMVTLLYNLADTVFVGMLNDPSQTASVSMGASFLLMLTAISNLFGIGGANTLAQALGRKEDGEVPRISSVSFWFGLFTAVIFSAFIFILMNPLLVFCGVSEETYAYTRGYVMWTVVFGGPGTILNILLANLIRSEGNSRLASIGVSAGSVLNIVLDPIFVLPAFLNMGVIGAGIATAISNLVVIMFFLLYLIINRKKTLLSLRLSHLSHTRSIIWPVLSKGAPSAAQYALTVVAVAAITKFVSAYGTTALAGFGIAKKLNQVPLYFSIGVANGLLPLLAYNYSSGNRDRQKHIFRYGCGIAVCFSGICLIVYELFASQLSSLFISNEETISYAASFLRRMVVAMPLTAFNYPMITQFQAMGKVKESLICSIIRKGVIDIPLLFLMDHIAPLYGLMWVQPIVDLVALLVASWFYFRIFRPERLTGKNGREKLIPNRTGR